MTTPRKAWFRVPSAILHEIPHEHRGTLVSLVALMNDRWARDGLTAEQATSIALGRGDLMNLTGHGRPGYCTAALCRALAHTSAEVYLHGTDPVPTRYLPGTDPVPGWYGPGTVTVKWAKVADYQGWHARERPDERPLLDAPAPAPAKEKSRTPKRDAPALSQQAVGGARMLAMHIRKTHPHARIPPDLKTWAAVIDRMLRIDQRSEKQVAAVIRYLFGENLKQEASFVVLSPKALRDKYDRIVTVMKKAGLLRPPPEKKLRVEDVPKAVLRVVDETLGKMRE